MIPWLQDKVNHMKTLISIIVSCQVCCDLSAAAFQNLDFDEVRLPLGPAVVPVERALLERFK